MREKQTRDARATQTYLTVTEALGFIPVEVVILNRTWKLEIRNKQMCRNIKTLHNFKPPATEEEIRASAIQFVRKLSGFTKPSKANEPAFNHAVEQVTKVATELLDSLVTNAPPRDREVEAAKARERSAMRFGGAPAV
jgi:hypothetical protein